MGELPLIYFIQAGPTGLVKIGTTNDMDARLKKMKTDCPDEPWLRGALPGDRVKEKELHAQFDACRVRGEWFESDPVLDWLERETNMFFPRRMPAAAFPGFASVCRECGAYPVWPCVVASRVSTRGLVGAFACQCGECWPVFTSDQEKVTYGGYGGGGWVV